MKKIGFISVVVIMGRKDKLLIGERQKYQYTTRSMSDEKQSVVLATVCYD